jgi:anti-sigma regulatory factor (Ser/Thr protein kinase)
VTVAGERATGRHDGSGHDALFTDDEAVLASTSIGFVREGVERGEVVTVASGRHPVGSLLRAVFAGEPAVTFLQVPRPHSPARMIEDYRRGVDRSLSRGARGCRLIAFADPAGTRLPWQEWVRYEAAFDHAFAGAPVRALCPYDTAYLDGDQVEALTRAHTGLVDGSGRRTNGGYVEPGRLVREAGLRTPPFPLETAAPRMTLAPGTDLDDLRVELYSATVPTHLPRRQVDDFVTAVTELVRNAHRHGAAPVTLRLWTSGTAVVARVVDRGAGIEDPLAGYARPQDPAQGLGLWAVRQLVDVLDFEQGPDGFSVRAASFV